MVDHTDHYFVGLTQQSSAGGLARLCGHGVVTLPASRVYPVGARFDEFVQPLLRLLNGDDHVREIVLRPVLGRYGVSEELSVGLEVKAAECRERGHRAVAAVARDRQRRRSRGGTRSARRRAVARLRRRTALCDLLLEHRPGARLDSFARAVVAEIDRYGVAAWDPELADDGLRAAWAVLGRNDENQAETDALLARIAPLNVATTVRLIT